MQSLKVSLNLQRNNQTIISVINKNKAAIIKPAAQQGFCRHAHFLHIHLSVPSYDAGMFTFPSLEG